MSEKLYNEADVQNIATAIRGKNGQPSTTKYKLSQMSSAIGELPSVEDVENIETALSNIVNGSF